MPTILKSLLLMSLCLTSFIETQMTGKNEKFFSNNGPSHLLNPFSQTHEIILSKNNSKEYLKIIDYDKNQANFYSIADGRFLKTIKSTYDDIHFGFNPSSSFIEVLENWNFETGKVTLDITHEIPYNNPMIKRYTEFPDSVFLNRNYFAFVSNESQEFNIADLSSTDITSFKLDEESYDNFPYRYNCEETTGICVIGTVSGKVYIFDYKNKRGIDKFSIDDLKITKVIAIIPNSPYILIEKQYDEKELINYKEKSIIELVGDWSRNGYYRTYPNNDGSKALFYKTWTESSHPGYAQIIDIIKKNVLNEFKCPSTKYTMELESADISTNGQYVALGCRDNKGNGDEMDDSGIVFVYHTTNPEKILYSIDSIGLGITENGSYFATVEFYP